MFRTGFDVTDEALFDATPTVIFDALLDEFEGVTGWWKPWVTFERQGKRASGEVGAVHRLCSFHANRPVLFTMKTMESSLLLKCLKA